MVAMDWPSRDQLMEFIQEKDRIDNEIREGNSVLDRNNVGMQDPLLDMDGFPRSDIAVYKVRQKIICLKKYRMNPIERIEQHLGKAHAKYLISNHNGMFGPRRCALYAYDYEGPNCDEDSMDQASFATVGHVQEGSPADLGGLRQNDKFLQFGSINTSNFTDIRQLQNIVRRFIDQPLNVLVKRDREIINLTIVPQRWERPGLFGCQIMKQWCIVRVTT
ncbi:26S proteasome non-ATPase regulatory subunit 9-like [Vanessa atalanta]|uniref:26S proteasome non-ATPase regulatory subunit 9-like n=1 Tax=Vanessa atalanta TaxID=42275 RepID=UPI001FCCE3B5|nr:26S proteasome non-ATPase regulatory subunit 9-like [Vanessa atalanta]